MFCIIVPDAEVRHRSSTLAGSAHVVVNDVELKNVILFDKIMLDSITFVAVTKGEFKKF